VENRRFELLTLECKSSAFPITPIPQIQQDSFLSSATVTPNTDESVLRSRTAPLLLQSSMIILFAVPILKLGGTTETRTQKPDYAGRQISNLLQYHYGTVPIFYLYHIKTHSLKVPYALSTVLLCALCPAGSRLYRQKCVLI
jgi:hypothetical protein